MESAGITIIVKNWVAIVAALIGMGLGIYNLLEARKSAHKKKQEEEEDWKFYVSLINEQREHPSNLIYTPELGSNDHRVFERLAIKGLVFRKRSGNGIGFTLEHSNHS